MAKKNKPCPVVHFEVNTGNLTRSSKFYGELFNWKIRNMPGANYAMVEARGDKKGQINGGINGDGAKSFATFYVQVPDVKTTFAQARKAGGKVMFGPEKLKEMGITIGLIADPDGNPVGVMHED